MSNKKALLSLVLGSTVLVGCSAGGYEDLDAYMAEKKARPGGVIEPIPAFQTYKAFTYGAAGMRSPFEKPIEVKEIARLQASTNVKPDKKRVKEYLEQFSLDSLTMVGTLEQTGTLWILLQDREGSVHRVKKGNFLGRNHGKIVEASDSYLSVIEIVPSGGEGWVERPRTIKLKTTEE